MPTAAWQRGERDVDDMTMKTWMCLWGMLVMLIAADAVPAGDADTDLQLRYVTPAASFTQALPLGNGRMGAMVYGGVGHARYSLSENTMWSGSRYPEPDRKDAAPYLPKIRQLLLAVTNVEAERLTHQHFNLKPFRAARSSADMTSRSNCAPGREWSADGPQTCTGIPVE